MYYVYKYIILWWSHYTLSGATLTVPISLKPRKQMNHHSAAYILNYIIKCACQEPKVLEIERFWPNGERKHSKARYNVVQLFWFKLVYIFDVSMPFRFQIILILNIRSYKWHFLSFFSVHNPVMSPTFYLIISQWRKTWQYPAATSKGLSLVVGYQTSVGHL